MNPKQEQVVKELLEKISNQAVCVGITGPEEWGDMLYRILEWSDEALEQFDEGTVPSEQEDYETWPLEMQFGYVYKKLHLTEETLLIDVPDSRKLAKTIKKLNAERWRLYYLSQGQLLNMNPDPNALLDYEKSGL